MARECHDLVNTFKKPLWTLEGEKAWRTGKRDCNTFRQKIRVEIDYRLEVISQLHLTGSGDNLDVY